MSGREGQVKWAISWGSPRPHAYHRLGDELTLSCLRTVCCEVLLRTPGPREKRQRLKTKVGEARGSCFKSAPSMISGILELAARRLRNRQTRLGESTAVVNRPRVVNALDGSLTFIGFYELADLTRKADQMSQIDGPFGVLSSHRAITR